MTLDSLLEKAELFLQRLSRIYARIFGIDELRREPIVQWMFGASLFYFFVSFTNWNNLTNTTVETAQAGNAICWPYFQECTKLYFLHTFPYGYSQQFLYMFFYSIMGLIVYRMWRSEWVQAHALMLLLFLWKLLVIFVLSYVAPGPYDYYHVILTAVILFAHYKEYFLKLAFVIMYFMSVTVKFTPAWVEGTYFTSMRSGLPLFPPIFTILLTNLVIFVQIIDAWFLMSKNWVWQRISFLFALIFHLYSGVLVQYNYPSVSVPAVLILFGPMYRYTPTPFGRKSLGGWIIILLVCLFQLLGFLVSPNRFLTLEGHRYGMFMFEANHQCQITFTTHTKRQVPASTWSGMQCTGLYCLTDTTITPEEGGTKIVRRMESASSWNRCDPYEVWFRAKSTCTDPAIKNISMQFDHSINGGPFYRIINENNICDLAYKPFSHNSWIKVPPEAPVVGYPVQNFYTLP